MDFPDDFDPRCMTQEREDLLKLIERIELVVPYVTATIGSGNTFPSEKRKDWVECHKGRCFSSNNQLEHLLKEARRLKEKHG